MFDFLTILKTAKRARAFLLTVVTAGTLLASVAAYNAGKSFTLEREETRITRELAALAASVESAPNIDNKTEIRRLPLFALEFKWGKLVAVDNLSAPDKVLSVTGGAGEATTIIPRTLSFDNASGVLEADGALIFYERLKGGDGGLVYIVNKSHLNTSVFQDGFLFYIFLFIAGVGGGVFLITLHIRSILKTVKSLQSVLDRAVSGEFAPVEVPAHSAELALLQATFSEKLREFNASDKFIETASLKTERFAAHKARIDKATVLRLEKHRLKTRGGREENSFLLERAKALKEAWKECLPFTASAALMRGFLMLWRHDLAVSIIKLREALRSPQENVPPELALIKVTSCLHTVKEELAELMEILAKSAGCSSFNTRNFYERLTHYLRIYAGSGVKVTSSFGADEATDLFYGFRFYYIKAILFLLGEIIYYLGKKRKNDAAVLLHILFKEEKLVVVVEDNGVDAAAEDDSDSMGKGEDPLFTVYQENLAEHLGKLEILNILHGRRYRLEFSSLGVRYAL